MAIVATLLGIMFFVGLIIILQTSNKSNKIDVENQTIDGDMTKKWDR